MTKRFTVSVTVLAAGVLLYAASDDLRNAMVNRVTESRRAVGMVAATLDGSGQEIIPLGKAAVDRPEELNGDTIFEIGSTTSLFTSLLLADMIERGEVKAETPVSDLLPATVKVPQRNGRKITLLDLSMHVSGLPRMPSNMKPKDLLNIYADYTAPKLYEFLSAYALTRDPGANYDYSNLGAGLLGHALARKAGMTYDELLRKRILVPLGMTSSGVVLSAEDKKRLATGYDPGIDPARYWDFDVLAGAGAMHSTPNDMVKFMAANLDATETPLRPAIRRLQSVRHPTDSPDLDIMMGWHVYKKYGTEILWVSGSTAGFWSFVGMDPLKKEAIVLLSNTYLNLDDIGLHQLENKWPLKPLTPRTEHTEIKLEPKVLAGYVGEYRFNPTFSLKVVLENGHLYGQAATQPRFELLAEKDTEFFVKVLESQVTFVKDKNGRTTGLILHQNGKRIPADKVR